MKRWIDRPVHWSIEDIEFDINPQMACILVYSCCRATWMTGIASRRTFSPSTAPRTTCGWCRARRTGRCTSGTWPVGSCCTPSTSTRIRSSPRLVIRTTASSRRGDWKGTAKSAFGRCDFSIPFLSVFSLKILPFFPCRWRMDVLTGFSPLFFLVFPTLLAVVVSFFVWFFTPQAWIIFWRFCFEFTGCSGQFSAVFWARHCLVCGWPWTQWLLMLELFQKTRFIGRFCSKWVRDSVNWLISMEFRNVLADKDTTLYILSPLLSSFFPFV